MLGTVAEAGVTFFAAVLLLMHRLRPDLAWRTRYISEYAVGRFGGLMTAAFVALGLGSGALAVALARGRLARAPSRLGVLLLGGYAAGMVATGLYRTDLSLPGSPITRTGRIHNVAAAFAFRCIVPAMLLLSHSFGRDRRWRPLRRPGMGLSVLAGASWLWLRYAEQKGRAQRAQVGVVVLWLGLVARRARVLGFGRGLGRR